ncbi:MAG: iron ABC transporter permease [Candidatus Acetothermia bacterium]|nr:iron ABC transporter permease [Candidatus Acetothermia bacterium]MDH7505141.1 iron ABC transporter permease [Candidatus Acetothermia bacterium]
MAFLACAFYYPLLRLFQEGVVEDGRVTLRYLAEVFREPYFRQVIQFTAEQALLSTLLAIALGLPWAYILTRYDFPLKRTVRSVTIVPFVLPAVTVALGFILFFGNNGYLNRLLMSLFHLQSPPLKLLYSLKGIVLAHAFYNAPIIARMVHAQWERLDPAYEESAQALGAGRLRRLWSLTLPLLLPSLMTGAALVFIFCFLSFPIVLSLGGARFSTLEVEIYTQFIVLYQRELGAALALIEVLLSLMFTYGYILLEGRFSRELEAVRPRPTVPLFTKPTWGKAALWAFILLSGLLFLGPLAGVVYDSFTREWAGRTLLTLDWYSYIFRPEYEALIGAPPLNAILNSLQFGLIAMAIAVLVGLPIAFTVARSPFRGRRLFDTIVMAPLGVSSVAVGGALLLAFLRTPLRGGWLAIPLAHAILSYPFVIRAVVPILEGLERSLVEAARGLGASRLRAFWEIELPLIRRGLLVGAVFAFALSLGEMSATIMLARPEWKTMPLVVNDLRAARSFGGASAMSTLLILVTSGSFIVIERFGERLFGGPPRGRRGADRWSR